MAFFLSVAAQGGSQGEPEILPHEILGPPASLEQLPWPPYEDPDTVECGDRAPCEAAVMNATEASP